MWGDDTAPHDTILAHITRCSLLLFFRPVHVGDALTHVKLSVFAVLDSFNLKARLLAVLVATITLVTEMDTVNVEADGFRHCEDRQGCDGWRGRSNGGSDGVSTNETEMGVDEVVGRDGVKTDSV